MRLQIFAAAIALAAPASDADAITLGREDWLGYCRNTIAENYGVSAEKVTVGNPKKRAKGVTRLTATIDKGAEGVKKAGCDYGRSGEFKGWTALTPDGK